MGIIDDIQKATRPIVINSARWPDVQFRVREISVSEAIATGGVTEKMLGSVMAAMGAGANGAAVRAAGQAAIEWAKHHEKVATIGLIGMRKWNGEGDEPEWEAVRVVYARPNPDLPIDDGVLWCGAFDSVDLQAIHNAAMGAASRAALSVGHFRNDGDGTEPGAEEGGRDSAEVRDAAEPTPMDEPEGAGA
jgi:hypothetical protein